MTIYGAEQRTRFDLGSTKPSSQAAYGIRFERTAVRYGNLSSRPFLIGLAASQSYRKSAVSAEAFAHCAIPFTRLTPAHTSATAA